jgi:hypothetical protein
VASRIRRSPALIRFRERERGQRRLHLPEKVRLFVHVSTIGRSGRDRASIGLFDDKRMAPLKSIYYSINMYVQWNMHA